MAMTEVVHVQVRESRGSREARRLRAQGQIPAVLYGHGEATVSLSLAADEIAALAEEHAR